MFMEVTNMVDIELFITALYVLVDDFMKMQPLKKLRGPDCKLSKSEAMTLLIFSQWRRFSSERDFYRFAEDELIPLFPSLPTREQLNRQFRNLHSDVCQFFQHLATVLGADDSLYEALDASAVVTRNSKRRGRGWLVGDANIGKSNRLGWYEGLKLLMSTTPDGVITGFGVAKASEKDQPKRCRLCLHLLAESFFYLRAHPSEHCPEVGVLHRGLYYPVDKGFEGKENHERWAEEYSAVVICPPKRNAKHPWSKTLRVWVASIRQIIETAFDKLLNTFRLDKERPHCLAGIRVRIAAKVALHNFCIWLNQSLGRNSLVFADLLGWSIG